MSTRLLRRQRGSHADDGKHEAAALAAVAVGLKPSIVTPEERKVFRLEHNTYLATRYFLVNVETLSCFVVG